MDFQFEPTPEPARQPAQELPKQAGIGHGYHELKQESETADAVMTSRPSSPTAEGPGTGDDDALHALHVPQDPDAPDFLPDFAWLGEPIPYPPETWEECITPLKQTAFILRELRKSEWPRTAELMQTTKEVARLWYSKKYHSVGNWKVGNPLPSDDRGRYATAMYLLCANKNTGNGGCRQCLSITSKGPGYECVQPSQSYIKSACTNCYGKGAGTTCSLRLAADQNKKENPLVIHFSQPERADEELRSMPTKDLEIVQKMFKAELRRRREQKAETRKILRQ